MKIKHLFISYLFVFGLLLYSGFIGENHGSKNESEISTQEIESPYTSLIEDYENFLLQEMDSTNNVGSAIAIVIHDSVRLLNTYGVRKAGTTDSVNINTVFRLASVSKGFAGVLACILDQKEVISLDDKIVDYLNGFKLKDSTNTNQLTIRHTLNHTSGLVPHAFDNLVEANLPMSEIISRLNEVNISDKPGKIYGYQNAIFSLIDTVLKAKSGIGYNEYLNSMVFSPLNMSNASVDYENFANSENKAFPHGFRGGKYYPQKLNKGYYRVAPAAGVNASILDMSKWLKALLGSNPDVIDSSIISKISTPTIYTPLRRRYTWRWDKIDARHYSIGWRIFKYKGRDILYHGGYVRGYRAEIAVCLNDKTGIVFLQNSPNRLASKSIPEFWKRYFPISDSLSYKIVKK